MLLERNKPVSKWGFPPGGARLVKISTRRWVPTLGTPGSRVIKREAEHQSLGGRAVLLMPWQGFTCDSRGFGWDSTWTKLNPCLYKPGMLWGRAISLSTACHTLKMHNFLTQTINAGIPRHWQHNAKITFYSCNRIARDSCWWQAKTLTFSLWRRLGPWSHHSSPELLRVGGITGGVFREEKVTGKYGLEKSHPCTVSVLIQGVRCGKKTDNDAEKVFMEVIS